MKRILVTTGVLGLVAAVLVGIGEYLLHYDQKGRFSASGYDYMVGISATRSTIGHFFGVFGAALYPLGCYHIYLMLRPAHHRVALCGLLISAFGFVVGTVWIGSRASISALVQLPQTEEIATLVALYQIRYETLLQFIRLTTLALSAIIIWLSIGGRSYYPRWIGIFNPILLIIINFILFAVVPALGQHTMPIALNIAFFIFFLISILVALRLREEDLTPVPDFA